LICSSHHLASWHHISSGNTQNTYLFMAILFPAPHRNSGETVAANCQVCGKGPSFGHKISHSHRRTNRRWNPNIQRIKALVGVNGVTPKRLNVCTSCLKAGKVKR
jgi:large subunit ribosomal protein L28